jgi:hypothetical protein
MLFLEFSQGLSCRSQHNRTFSMCFEKLEKSLRARPLLPSRRSWVKNRKEDTSEARNPSSPDTIFESPKVTGISGCKLRSSYATITEKVDSGQHPACCPSCRAVCHTFARPKFDLHFNYSSSGCGRYLSTP